jgi:hypothetical protein
MAGGYGATEDGKRIGDGVWISARKVSLNSLLDLSCASGGRRHSKMTPPALRAHMRACFF